MRGVRSGTRKLFNRSFTFVSVVSIVFMALSLVILLGPIFVKGSAAFVFRGTIEYRRLMLDRFDRGDAGAIEAEKARADAARKPVLDAIRGFEAQLDTAGADFRGAYGAEFKDLKDRYPVAFAELTPEAAVALTPRELLSVPEGDPRRAASDAAWARPRSWTGTPKYSRDAAPTPKIPGPSSAVFRYSSRMRSLPRKSSSRRATTSSPALRTRERSGVKYRFLASCCVRVLRPLISARWAR